MLKRFFRAVLCSVILIGKIHAQEVIVAREKKSELPKQKPQRSEEVLESPTPGPRKSKSRGKKSNLTLEEMRAAGARAAGGSNDGSGSESTKTREPVIEHVPMPNPTVAGTPRSAKRETSVEQQSSSRSSRSKGTNVEGIGPIRPTMMESGREAPSPSPR
jgi:hypothetical protein